MRPLKPKELRRCAVCQKPLPEIRRKDMVYCSPTCRVRGWALRLQERAKDAA